ncbi:MAG: bifunctional methylenetetrahydrofolate dehydrogenase/methenyltetrahydrofolate cyclohydrolase FolD [Parvibaculum sp.]|uniref:bifunctional methylenetetrahydrofolate dehydrogenase/methenyltetrahydrofolate cyclohydrolase FolD n=1 Tax=Parvibaculum sp. TaxID=2024848 RepID=UPI002723FE83|nr:bifunctional methylenetetrahydrofolate dehydrogenase/methenyltetrahydrofolate cyclohydrolase FolD [Parvibaculum sp.]MDO8837673.1 bifunctional methylenetetrahydrofolate dehydrogenase/methenyltetrahydrofolate cyclohydrolase FolD [Parvibaculum sp.]
MSEARIIDGKSIADALRARVATEVARLRNDHGLTPGLAVVLVGSDPASEIYVRNKGMQTKEAGMNSWEFKLPDTTTQDALLAKVRELNADPAVHGILVQFPVPAQISQQAVIETIDPDKDVDGLHPVSAGRLASGLPGLVPATPTGCLVLAREAFKARGETLAGKHAVVVGRSNLVGKPVAQLLLGENCTVTIAHSRTIDLPSVCRMGDILVAATGRAEMIRGSWVKPGAVVIDVGTTRLPAPERGAGKMRLVGDVAFAEAKEVAGDITPVPGGVGPMTIACLLRNTLFAASRIHGIAPPQDL